MTANQLSYWRNVETERSNRASEAETNRSNLAKEAETARHNRHQESLASREDSRDQAMHDAKLPAVQASAALEAEKNRKGLLALPSDEYYEIESGIKDKDQQYREWSEPVSSLYEAIQRVIPISDFFQELGGVAEAGMQGARDYQWAQDFKVDEYPGAGDVIDDVWQTLDAIPVIG